MTKQCSLSHSSSVLSTPSISTPVQEFGRNMLNLAFNLHVNTETVRTKPPHFEELQLPVPHKTAEFDSYVIANDFPSNSQLFRVKMELEEEERPDLLEELGNLFSVVAYDASIIPESERLMAFKFFITCHVDHFLESDRSFQNLIRITQQLAENMQITQLVSVFTVSETLITHVDYYLTYLALGNICGQAIFNYICEQFKTLLNRKFPKFTCSEGDEELFCIFLICQLVSGDKQRADIKNEAESFYRVQSDIGKVSLRCEQLLHTYILLEEE